MDLRKLSRIHRRADDWQFCEWSLKEYAKTLYAERNFDFWVLLRGLGANIVMWVYKDQGNVDVQHWTTTNINDGGDEFRVTVFLDSEVTLLDPGYYLQVHGETFEL